MDVTKVLFVDDEAVLLETVKFGLEAMGEYRVRVVSDPREAEEAAQEFAPDVIVLDVMMPYMDGGCLASRLWNDCRTRDVPIIFQTAVLSRVDAERRKACKGYYLAKPISIKELRNVIDECTAGPAA